MKLNLENPRDSIFLFDLDGTITSAEILPRIARAVGLEKEMTELTMRTLGGEVAFDESFRYRVQLLSQIPIDQVVQVVLATPIHRQLLDWILDHKESCRVVTGNLDCWVSPWLEKHGLQGITSKARVGSSEVKVAEILRKESVLQQFPDKRIIAIGDGANDAQLLAESHIGVACALVHSVPRVVLEVADYVVLREEELCRTLSRLL